MCLLPADFDVVTLAYVCAKARATAGPMLTKLATGYCNVSEFINVTLFTIITYHTAIKLSRPPRINLDFFMSLTWSSVVNVSFNITVITSSF